MKYLNELTGGMEVVDSSVKKDYSIEGISQNYSTVRRNYLFFVSGVDGEKNIEKAIQNGAVVLVGEKMYKQAPSLVVKDVRKAVACAARAFYDYPDKELKIIGVVGTNGKTTVTHILKKLFDSCGIYSIVIGTLGVFIGSERYETGCTTPDSADFYRYLREGADKKIKYAFVEVSAHAVFYRKLYGMRFEMGIFTNFSQDHLDFFKTMERYREVKKSFFNKSNVKCAIVNTDDEVGREIYQSEKMCCIGYGINNPGDVFAMDVRYGIGTDFLINAFDDIIDIHSPLYGEFNVSNLLAAVTVCKMYGMKGEEIRRGVLQLDEIEGRFNVIHWRSKIVIDYAHSPDGMKKVLSCVRKMCLGKVICVFGCGGDRDKIKRPIMGKIATELADLTILTSDNSRSEKPEDIIADIKKGTEKEVLCIPNRSEAVKMALQLSKRGDMVVLLGKGAERYMEENGKKIPYSDSEICREYIGSHPCQA